MTFFAVSGIIVLISILSFKYLFASSKENLFSSKLEAGKRESREIGKLLELQLKRRSFKTNRYPKPAKQHCKHRHTKQLYLYVQS